MVPSILPAPGVYEIEFAFLPRALFYALGALVGRQLGKRAIELIRRSIGGEAGARP
jgi:hypothetical protein